MVMGVDIQGEGYAKYFLEGMWKDLYEKRKCECDVDNLNNRLQSSRKRAATGHRFISLQKAKQSLTMSAETIYVPASQGTHRGSRNWATGVVLLSSRDPSPHLSVSHPLPLSGCRQACKVCSRGSLAGLKQAELCKREACITGALITNS